MAEFRLPKNSKINRGKTWPSPDDKENIRKLEIYRWNPDDDKNPKAPIPLAPNQLMLFSVADEILQDLNVKQENSACV